MSIVVGDISTFKHFMSQRTDSPPAVVSIRCFDIDFLCHFMIYPSILALYCYFVTACYVDFFLLMPCTWLCVDCQWEISPSCWNKVCVCLTSIVMGDDDIFKFFLSECTVWAHVAHNCFWNVRLHYFFKPFQFHSFICKFVVKSDGNFIPSLTHTHECVDYRYIREYVFVFGVNC